MPENEGGFRPESEGPQVIKKEMIAKTETTVPSGQEWHVEMVAKSQVTIENGAKLVVIDMASGNKFIIHSGGELEIQGMDVKNEIENVE